MAGNWVFPGKGGMTVSGRGKMQIADTRDQGKGVQTMEHERTENVYFKKNAKLS